MCDKIPGNAAEGFTLIELLIAMAAGLVVMGTAYQTFVVQRKIYAVQEQVTEMNQNARAAVDFMARELRMAISISSLDSTAGTSSITYVSIENTAQNRCFNLRADTLKYGRGGDCDPGGSPDPLAENISSLTITRAANLFTITLTARTAGVDPDRGTYRSITITSRVRPRCIQEGTRCS